jgi:hypothetical protein
MAGIIKWEQMVNSGASGGWDGSAAAPVPNSLTYEKLVNMARTSSSQQAAIQTIVQGIAMMDAISGPQTKTHGPAARLVVAHIVESAMILGYVPWQITQGGMPQVANPGDVLLARDAKSGGGWAPIAHKRAPWLRGTARWKLNILDEPYVVESVVSMTMQMPISASQLQSACARSYTAAARQDVIEHNWISRDKFNSSPSAFTYMSKDFGNAAGKLRPWFRDVNANMSTNLHFSTSEVDTDNPSDFRELISRRADTIRELSKNTAMERDSFERRVQIKNASTLQGRAEAAFGPIAQDHQEYAISDGKDLKPTPTLLSTVDGHMHYAKARQTVLLLCGVPPQAIGESVNSERNASNHRQYEVAMGLYHASLRRMRQLVNDILEECGVGVQFEATMPIHTLESLAPVLKTDSLAGLMAKTHNIDTKLFDMEALALWQTSLLGGAKVVPDDPAEVPNEQRDSKLEKKRAKRNHVEPTE